MTPVSPVLKSSSVLPEIVFAKDQPEYLPLPAIRSQDGIVTTRWNLNWAERLRVVFSGDVWLQQMTFNSALQPILVTTQEPTPEQCCPVAQRQV